MTRHLHYSTLQSYYIRGPSGFAARSSARSRGRAAIRLVASAVLFLRCGRPLWHLEHGHRHPPIYIQYIFYFTSSASTTSSPTLSKTTRLRALPVPPAGSAGLGPGTQHNHNTTAHASENQPHTSESHPSHLPPTQAACLCRRSWARLLPPWTRTSTSAPLQRRTKVMTRPTPTTCAKRRPTASSSSCSTVATSAPPTFSSSTSAKTVKHCKSDETHRLRKNLGCEVMRATAPPDDDDVELTPSDPPAKHARPPPANQPPPAPTADGDAVSTLGRHVRHLGRQLARVHRARGAQPRPTVHDGSPGHRLGPVADVERATKQRADDLSALMSC